MALVNCVECGNKISDSAEACPNCGFPMCEYISYVNNEKQKRKEEKIQLENERKAEEERLAEEKRLANIKCYECCEIIGSVDICPHCGFSMIKYKQKTEELERKRSDLQRINQNNVSLSSYHSSASVTCPYCKSINVKKISTSSRAVSTLAFGIMSKKIGKQWHCNNCKSDF